MRPNIAVSINIKIYSTVYYTHVLRSSIVTMDGDMTIQTVKEVVENG
jgi:hypothetical protein